MDSIASDNPRKRMVTLPRLRQAVLAARDLDAVADELRSTFDLGEPFADPGVEYFGLRNAVFALGDTFLEVVSPLGPDTPAGRWIERRGGDCGYMVMFQVDSFAAARERARAEAVREVFEVSLPDMAEVHLHPADMRGAIVSLSAPEPPDAWRWGGPGWQKRAADLTLAGATIAVEDPDSVRMRWERVVGELPGMHFERDDGQEGLVEIALHAPGRGGEERTIGGARFVQVDEEDRE